MPANQVKTRYTELIEKANQYYKEKNYKEAIKAYKIIILVLGKKLTSNQLANIYIGLANSYFNLNDIDKSTYYYEEYLKLYPQGQINVYSRLAHAYYFIDTDKSIDYHNRALNIDVNRYDVSCKLFAMTKSSYYDQQDIKEQSEYEVNMLKSHLYKNIQKFSHKNKKKNKKNKKLNIAYISSDCYAHTMMNYMLPIWTHHNKEKYNFYIFNGSDKEDATTNLIKNTGIEVIPCATKNDEEIAKLIYSKDIDILVDLGGYTHMKIFSNFYKPAPIIILYLGYLNTLGMNEVDYILADKYTIPEEKSYLYTENILYLNEGYQIFKEKELPELTPNPYKTNGYITFGSFNCTSKISDTTIYLWSEILKAEPTSKLLIYRTKMGKKTIKVIKEKFETYGIDSDRILFNSKVFTPHFHAYSYADISLDTYPFSGMSIAIETALMGVPTITLVGEGMHSRGAGRINEVIQNSDFNTENGEDYIKSAINLANNKEKLNELRINLRNIVNNSSLKNNHKSFVIDLENCYEYAWRNFINSP